ncbi:MAG: DUF1990 family protein [Saprospiraceae bacterium]
MQFQLSKPSPSEVDAFVQEKARAPYNYKQVYGTKSPPVAGFDNDHKSTVLGKGEDVWQVAKIALDNWRQFPSPWTTVEPKVSLKENRVVAVFFRLFGIWFINGARIVYTLDSKTEYGFAYGTLPGHVEKGEECFWIERDESGEVSYHIRAFSQPAHWLVWLGYPIARYFQRRFVRESLETMKRICNGTK